MRQSFYLSNAVPQDGSLNRGPWRLIEELIRDTARRDDVAAVWVVTGPAWLPSEDSDSLEIATVGQRRVWVPTHVWKAALWFENDEPRSTAFLCENSSESIAEPITVDELEATIGIDLWPDLAGEIEQRAESNVAHLGAQE